MSAQDVEQELKFQARQAEALGSIAATPAAVIERYRHARAWRSDKKDFLFHCVQKYSQERRVCDFGCGSGETSTELAAIGYEVVGFDVSPELIALARRRAELDNVADRTQFLIADAHQLELSASSFQTILVQAVLHHLDFAEGLDTLDSLLAPGGIAVIQEPIAFSRALQWFRDRTPVPKEISPNERQLNPDDIRQIESRFDVLDVRYFHLTNRLARLVPAGRPAWRSKAARMLKALDQALLSLFPPLRRLAGILVMVCRKRG